VPLLERLKRLEGLAAGVLTMKKSESACPVLPGIKTKKNIVFHLLEEKRTR
jgi:hypothetical protein